MRIIHRIALEHDHPIWREIDELALSYKPGPIISVLEIYEDAPDWTYVRRLLVDHDIQSTSSNLYSPQEVADAQWLTMAATGHHGYPMPDGDFGYRRATYDLSRACARCGIGKVQNAPFRIRSEFKPSRSHFLQLNWVFDEFFVRAPVAASLGGHGITGISFMAPLLHRSNQPSQETLQMRVTTHLPMAIDVSGLQQVTCKTRNEEWRQDFPAWLRRDNAPECGSVKYHLRHRGPLRVSTKALNGAPDAVKSQEWFGSGGSAFQLLIVSQRFCQLVRSMGWRGLHFEPLELFNPELD